MMGPLSVMKNLFELIPPPQSPHLPAKTGGSPPTPPPLPPPRPLPPSGSFLPILSATNIHEVLHFQKFSFKTAIASVTFFYLSVQLVL